MIHSAVVHGLCGYHSIILRYYRESILILQCITVYYNGVQIFSMGGGAVLEKMICFIHQYEHICINIKIFFFNLLICIHLTYSKNIPRGWGLNPLHVCRWYIVCYTIIIHIIMQYITLLIIYPSAT